MVAVFTGLGAGFERGSGAALGGMGLLGSSSLGRGGESAFLNAATGNLVLTRQDEFLVGRGPDVAIARTYNSLGNLAHDDNGDLWRQSSDRRVFGLSGTVNTTGSTIKRLSADGSEITYTWNGSHYATTDGAGAHDRLSYSSATDKWTWTDGSSRITETYSLSVTGVYRITQQADTDGNTLTFTYVSGQPDKLDKVTTQDGSWVQYAWTGSNITTLTTGYTDLVTSTAKALTRTRYAYDASNRLITVTTDLSPEDNSVTDANTYWTSYTYDGTSKRVASITQKDGSSLEIAYYTSADAPDPAFVDWVKSFTLTAAAADTRITSVHYVNESADLRRTEVTDPRGQVIKLWSKRADDAATQDTDERGQLVRVLAPPAITGATPQEVNYTYDGSGNVTSVVTKSGATTLSTMSYQYDAQGNVTQITDANGNVTTRSYDSSNSITLETRTGSSASASSISLHTRYVYDGENHLRYVISAEGRVTEYRYKTTGELERTIDYPQHAYTAIAAPTLATETQMNTWRDGLSDRSTTMVTRLEYDARGGLTNKYVFGAANTAGVELTTEGYRAELFTYDQSGQLLGRGLAPNGFSEAFVYDGLGRLTASTDLAGGTTTIVFNDAATTTTVTTASGYTTISTYNKAGELISRSDVSTTDAYLSKGEARYVYDKNGRVRMSIDATGRKSFYLYDNLGNKVADIGQDGQVIEYKYDQLNRVVASVRYNAPLNATQLGQLDDEPPVEIEYGSAAFPRPAADNVLDGSADIWQWNVYDTGGRVIETILGDGSVTTYAYDQADRLVATTSYSNKLSAGQITTLIATPPNAVITPTADTSKDRISRTFYDRDGRLIGALNAEGALSRVIYDSAGLKVQELAYANLTAPAQRASGTFDQLLTSTALDAAKDVSIRYVYDGQGLLRYTIDALNRVSELIYWEGAGNEFRANGLVRKTIAYAASLGTVANYSYATIKAALAALPPTYANNVDNRASYNVYNDRGQLGYAVDALGGVTGVAYDSMGRVTSTTQFAAAYAGTWGAENTWKGALDTWAGANATGARITRNYYNKRGELRFVVDAEGYVSGRTYDAEGRLWTESRFANRVTDFSSIDAINNANKGAAITLTHVYDNLGRLNYSIDQAGSFSFFLYYATGKLSWEIVGNWVDNSRTLNSYNQAGQKTAETRYTSERSNASFVGTTAVQLNGAQQITSPDGQYAAVLTREGEFKLFHKAELIWTSGVRETVAGASYRLVAQTDGNLVVYRDVSGQGPVAVWNSNTAGAHAGSTFIALSNTGELSLNKGTAPTSAGVIWTAAGLAAHASSTTSVTTTYAYDGLGNVSSLTDPNGIVTNFTYDRIGRVLTRIDAAGTSVARTTTFEYDAFGRGVKTIDAKGNASFAFFDQLGRVIKAVDAENYVTETGYTAFSEILSVTRRANTASNTVNVTTPPVVTADATRDATTSFVYDKLGRVTQSTDAQNGVELYEYNAFGQRTAMRNKILGWTDYTYDQLGRLVEEKIWFTLKNATTPVFTINKYEYDSRGNLTKKREASDAAGTTALRTTNYAYDHASRLVSRSTDAFDAASSSTAATANITPTEYFYYDARGNLIESRDAAGARTLFWYDKLNRVTHSLSPLGTLTRTYYDANGNVVETRIYATQLTLPASAAAAAPVGAESYRITQYTYDGLNRVKEARTPNARTAVYASGVLTVTPEASLVTLTTTYDYDAMNNVVRVIDAKGAQTYSYYDKLGRKLAQYDALNYRTDWTYDANSNVLSEKRYANAGTSGGSSIPVTLGVLPANLPALDGANDRVTNFTYDRIGQRLTETRTGVVVHNGSGGTNTASATITYSYNGLGEVLTKAEASGDAITYAYDAGGRMTSEQRSGYTDFAGAAVNPRVEYAYNGLNDLAQTKAAGNANAVERITAYTYGAGGRLLSKTDAAGFIRTYRYDAAGRVSREEYVRVKADGSSATEAVGYDYDSEGRISQQGVMVWTGAAWSRSGAAIDTAMMHYNAFGEVSEQGLNGVYAQKFEYDSAGRLVRTNSGDGAWKYFMYDGAGNQTLAIQSVGTDLNAAGTDTLQEVLGLWTGGTSTIATANITGVVATITRYDARNQAIEVREPQRQLTAAAVPLSDLTATRAYNAFGDVAYEINALNARVDYSYNTMGRLIKVESPAVSVTAENGTVTTNVRPTEHRYYDASGRLVASRDANSNLTKYTLLAGTGYGGTQALITEAYNADGGVIRTKYDIHGDARRIENALYNTTTAPQHKRLQNFDAMGRVIQVTQEGGLIDYYRYDGLGQRIRRFNSFYNPSYNATSDPTGAGASEAEKTLYDAQGRVTQVIAPGGDATNYAFAWDGTLITNGMTTSVSPFGGWTQTTTYANGKTLIEKTDVFGRAVGKTDLGGNVTGYAYDTAGRLTQRTGGITLSQTYFNTGKLAMVSQNGGWVTSLPGGAGGWASETISYREETFGYDALGNVTAQKLRETGLYEWETAGHYDGEGYWEPGESGSNPIDQILSDQTAVFDALGRIVQWNELGGVKSPIASHIFQYDANGNIRRTLASFRALNASGVAAATPTTQDYWYRFDAMNRMTTAKGTLSGGVISRGTAGIDITYRLDGTRAFTLQGSAWREDYTYDAEGRVTQVNGGTSLSAAGIKRAAFTYDALGRQTAQTDYLSTSGYLGAGANLSRVVVYNAKNQIVSEDWSEHRNNDVYRTLSTYAYGTGATYALGAVTEVVAQNWKDGAVWPTTKTTNTYTWRDGAVQTLVTYDPDNNPATNNNNTSTFTYDIIGGTTQLRLVNITDGNPRKVTFTSDMLAQAIRREQTGTGATTEVWYRYSGRQMGRTGFSVDGNVNYYQSNQNRVYGANPVANADFDLAYDHITTFEQGSSGGAYTVQSGDTLQSIAANLWGDANLWYKIAEVNGLTAESALIDGQTLIIPVGVQTSANNASTFKPYDPLEVLGNVSPTSPTPKKGKNCGLLGTLIVHVVAFVVAMVIDRFVPGAGTYIGKVLTQAVSNAAGQGVAIAAGVQEKFSWNQVGMAAVGAAVGESPIGNFIASKVPGGEFARLFVKGAVDDAITQGIGKATGMQEKFSWASVAAAGLSQAYVGRNVGKVTTVGKFVHAFAARTLISATMRSLIEGDDFGDAMMEAMPGAFVSSLGNYLHDSAEAREAAERAAEREDPSVVVARVQRLRDGLAATNPELFAPLDIPSIAPLEEDLGWGSHTIAEGDSYWTLAGGDMYRAMQYMEVNPGINPRALQIGQPITVPGYNVEVSEATARAWARSDAEYRQFLAAQAERAASIAFWSEVFSTRECPIGPPTDAQAVSMTMAMAPSVRNNDNMNLGGGALGTWFALNRGVPVHIRGNPFIFSLQPLPGAWQPPGGTTSRLFFSDPSNYGRGLRLDYGYNKNFGTVNWHWNQRGVYSTFGITNHSVQFAPQTGALTNVWRYGGRALVVAGVVQSGYDIYNSRHPVYETGRQASGWAGALAGGAAGAEFGAAVGAGVGVWFGGVGVVPGTLIGGFVGGLAGGAIGWWAGTETYEGFVPEPWP